MARAANSRMTVESWVELAAKQLSVDGLELYWGFLDPEEAALKRLRRQIEACGLRVPIREQLPWRRGRRKQRQPAAAVIVGGQSVRAPAACHS